METPDTLQQILAEMRKVCPHQEVFGDTVREWAGRIEALQPQPGRVEGGAP